MGCQLNENDSEKIAGMARKYGLCERQTIARRCRFYSYLIHAVLEKMQKINCLENWEK